MKLEELVAAVLNVPVQEVTDDTAPHNTANWTSKAQVQLVVAIDEVYQVTLSIAEIKQLTSVAATRRLLTDRGAAIV